MKSAALPSNIRIEFMRLDITKGHDMRIRSYRTPHKIIIFNSSSHLTRVNDLKS